MQVIIKKRSLLGTGNNNFIVNIITIMIRKLKIKKKKSTETKNNVTRTTETVLATFCMKVFQKGEK